MNGARDLAYLMLAITALAAVGGRIARIELFFEPSFYRKAGDTSPDVPPRDWPSDRPASMPTLSSNDRSRWCTVRALVDDGTWIIGRRDPALKSASNHYGDTGIVFEDGWKTVDKVLKPGTGEFYSSKPPLLTVAVAAEYWILKNLLGWSIAKDSKLVVRTILFTFNLLPLAVYLWMLKVLLDRHARSDWARLFVFAAACHGTFLNTFSVTLNNHTLAACTALAAVFPLLNRASTEQKLFAILPVPDRMPTGALALSGLFAGLTASLELPALAFSAALFALFVVRSPARTMLAFLPAVLSPLIVQQGLNFMAIGQWEPVYAKVASEWYRYEGSHWLLQPGQVKHGIDWAWQHESRLAYVFHVLVGHHGLFSLTPIWIFSFAAMGMATYRVLRRRADDTQLPQFFSLMTLVISLVLLGFYLVKSNNYGGMTSCLRWLLWLAPLWLIAMLPLADEVGKRPWSRRFAYLGLGIAVFSATYSAWNPWRHPWLYDLLEKLGIVRY